MRNLVLVLTFVFIVFGGLGFVLGRSTLANRSFLTASLFLSESGNSLETSSDENSGSQPVFDFSGDYCDQSVSFSDPDDRKLCFNPPKLNRWRLFEINLTDNRILFYENGLIKKIFPIAYQAPYGKWFQTPTGFFEIGVKNKRFLSSIFPVYMENAVQLYEDFFIHGIPYFLDGQKVTSQFSGGCLRLEDKIASDFFQTAQKGDAVVSYLTLNQIQLKDGFFAPVDTSHFWVRQRFNSPLKNDWHYFEDKRENYIQHAGLDLAPSSEAWNLSAFSIFPGTVEKIIVNGQGDGGLGNAVILRHEKEEGVFYSLYGHLDSIDAGIKTGDYLSGGSLLGKVGNTGFGCRFWKVGKDSCYQTGEDDVHLHLEIKTASVLDSPLKDNCSVSGKGDCIGYTSQNPDDFGFFDPLKFLFNNLESSD